MSNLITMYDVAQAAGVSLMTVSRVVNNKGDVSPATRQRVQEVIERLDYRPSSIARSLATKKTGTIGCVVPDVSNPFFARIVQGVENVAYTNGYNVFLCNTEEKPERELDVLRSLEEKRIDGLILCSTRLNDHTLQDVLSRHPASVLINRRLESNGPARSVETVMLDDVTGGRMATQHLIDTGHRAIGLLMGPPASFSGRQRTVGYHAAMSEAGIPVNPEWTRHCPPLVEGGVEAARRLFTAHPELTAVYCYNDLVAVGALQALADLGRRVPEDVAVVGSDDIPLAALVTPPLTTCQAPRYEIGVQAVRSLLEQINGCNEGCGEIVLPFTLVIRSSAPAQVSGL